MRRPEPLILGQGRTWRASCPDGYDEGDVLADLMRITDGGPAGFFFREVAVRPRFALFGLWRLGEVWHDTGRTRRFVGSTWRVEGFEILELDQADRYVQNVLALQMGVSG